MSDLIVRNLNFSYGENTIFKDFNISFKEGSINVILGGSGVGKTTLLNCIAGIKKYDGIITGDDEGISYIFQKDRLIPSISVFKNLDLILKSVYKDKKERKEKIEIMLDLLEISDIKNALPTTLSGGQAQRVSIARAFLFPSKVLLLDEPFKALDTALKARLLKALITLNGIMPRTIVFVTHAIDECLLSANKYFVFAGRPVGISLQGEIDQKLEERSLSSDELTETRDKLLAELFKNKSVD